MEHNKRLRNAADEFSTKAKSLPYVIEIALVGSTAGNDPYPNDLDIVVVLDEFNDIARLAKFARQISSCYNSWDVFIFNNRVSHLGRICHRKECPARSVDCAISGCGRIKHIRVMQGFKYNARQFLTSPIEILYQRKDESIILKKRKSLGIKEIRQYPILDDVELRCFKCGEEFIFSAQQQKSFQKLGFVAPKRCPECIEEDRLAGERDW